MGIKNLLLFLRPYMKKINMNELKNKRIGIDGYVWIHKGIFSDKMDIVDNINSNNYINYIIKNIKILKKYYIYPIFVFDGRKLCIKHKEVIYRQIRREEQEKKAMIYKKKDYLKYKKIMINTIKVGHEMTKKVIKKLDELNIEYIISLLQQRLQYKDIMKLANCSFDLIKNIQNKNPDLKELYSCHHPRALYDDKILELRLKGLTYRAIAAEIPCPYKTVALAIKRMRKDGINI